MATATVKFGGMPDTAEIDLRAELTVADILAEAAGGAGLSPEAFARHAVVVDGVTVGREDIIREDVVMNTVPQICNG